jgi:exodeoxyribonuclease V alpha subunit
VLDGRRLYLARYWGLERYVAADVATRAAATRQADPRAAATSAVIEDLFAAAADRSGRPLDAAQLAAARAVAERNLVVIAGGPGTGKTTTVARLLAGLAQARPDHHEGDRVALVAPTGKAAARMTEALGHAAAGLHGLISPEVEADLGGLEAVTIHRLLGRGRGRGTSFWHGPDNPLPHDLVIVDEASMVSLSLMAHLLAAISPDATVVLVGDPDQLASVEAGAVLNDLIGSTSDAVPTSAAASAVRASVKVLDVVHRQGEDSAILPLAAAIRAGRADEAIELLRQGDRHDVAWIEVPDDGPPVGSGARRLAELTAEVSAVAVAAVDAATAGDVDAALAAIGGTKVLAAMRRGRRGVDGWNRRIEDHLRRAGKIGRDPWHPGRPVMVTENDHLNEVFNGDVGVAIASDLGYRVVFPRGDGHHEVESVRLDRVATQWAMSIHKSQGSEFPHGVVVLPHSSARILTRELLYTGITRAKQRLTVVASEESIRVAVGRPVARASGLADRLRR